MLDKIQLLDQKIVLKDSIISNLNLKIYNLNTISLTKTSQLELSKELSKKLQSDLKKQRLKNKLTMGGGIIAVVATVLILK